PTTSIRGNVFGMTGMAIAALTTAALIVELSASGRGMIWMFLGLVVGGAYGAWRARTVEMTKMPELVAFFHSMIGLAAVFIAVAAVLEPSALLQGLPRGAEIPTGNRLELFLGAAIGAITFSGSVIAFGKLSGTYKFRLFQGAPVQFAGQHKLNLLLGLITIALGLVFMFTGSLPAFFAMLALAFVMGVLIIIPIGGADMPVVVSMLNSYSGWAAAGIGFTLGNSALIITGALVGSSGAILSYIMCHAMNRSFISVILGGFGGETVAASGAKETRNVKQGSPEDAAYIMQNAGKIIIVPGYGMAVAQAQHALREMADMLKKEGVDVSYAIHPVAGRMPGHMNVLLAEANVPYDEVFELEDINSEFAQADVAFVIGANDVTNPAAKTDKTSPIYGMPILDVEKAKTVLFLKRGMGSGYAGVENELFFRPNTMMLFGDAKKTVESIVKSLGH
ncbi:MAG: NAD(P)(+) transhydrogenase (Re/Si-specific) subunit beta, partial [Methylocystis sp.]|uniref:NAD(P)(+) transhydrogenase (Re/Si-specific) subunit beta n=1 Tax=Methylocystis sp. TaxID=1911079 RepID=UPI003DA36037